MSNGQVEEIFSKTRKARVGRVENPARDSIKAQRMSAWANPTLKFIDSYIAPLIDTSTFNDSISKPVVGCYEVQLLGRKGGHARDKRSMIPFVDETAAKFVSWWPHALLITAMYGALFYTGSRGLVVWPEQYGIISLLEAVVKDQKYAGHGQGMLDFS